MGVGGEATPPCAQPLRAAVAQRSKQTGWDSGVSMAFPDNLAVLLCIPMAWTRALPLPRLSLQPDPCPPPLLSSAGASQSQCSEGRLWWQDQIEDALVLNTDFDDPSAKFNKAELSL